MKQRTLIANYFAEVVYNICLVVIPLILIPYTSRVLGAMSLGAYGYVSAYSAFFSLLATLGTSIYAQREIAINKSAIKEKRLVVNIFKTRMGLAIICAGIMVIIGFFYYHYKYLFIIQSLYVLSNGFDTTWYNYGHEDFVSVTAIYMFFRIVGLVSILTLVKSREDIYIYALIYVVIEIVQKIIVSIPIWRIILENWCTEYYLYKEAKRILVLFIPTAAIQLYYIIDRIMIVLITGDDSENGYYEQATKIVAILQALTVETLSAVLLPRASAMARDGVEKLEREMSFIVRGLLRMLIPLTIGLMIMSQTVVEWMMGEEYFSSISLLRVLSINIIPMSVYSVVGNQIMLPLKRDKEYARSLVIGVIFNAIMNVFFISLFGAFGACIASLSSNIFIMVYQIYLIKDVCGFSYLSYDLIKPCIATGIMGCGTYFMCNRFEKSFIAICMNVVVSMIVYGLVDIFLRDVYTLEIIRNIRVHCSRK